jgi:hypothetical protein
MRKRRPTNDRPWSRRVACLHSIIESSFRPPTMVDIVTHVRFVADGRPWMWHPLLHLRPRELPLGGILRAVRPSIWRSGSAVPLQVTSHGFSAYGASRRRAAVLSLRARCGGPPYGQVLSALRQEQVAVRNCEASVAAVVHDGGHSSKTGCPAVSARSRIAAQQIARRLLRIGKLCGEAQPNCREPRATMSHHIFREGGYNAEGSHGTTFESAAA